MKAIVCNCLTKSPDPQYHMQNCPVWMASHIEKLEELINTFCESLQKLESVRNEIREGLIRDGRTPCSADFHRMIQEPNEKTICPHCKETL